VIVHIHNKFGISNKSGKPKSHSAQKMDAVGGFGDSNYSKV